MSYFRIFCLIGCGCLLGCSSAPLIKDANYYYNRGVQLAETDHLDEASQCFKEVLRQNPSHPAAHYNLGVIYDEKVMPKEATEEYRKAIRIDPRSYEAWHKLGVIESLEGNDGEAIRCFEEALKIEPRHQGANYNLAVLKAENGDVGGAISHYKKVIEINPKNLQALNNLGLLYVKKDLPLLAIECFRKAKMVDPNYFEAYNNLGIVYAQKGDYEKAAVEFERAIDVNRSNAKGYYNLIFIYKDKLHDYKKAKGVIQTFLSLKPGGPESGKLKVALAEIDGELARTNNELLAKKNDAINKDVHRFIENINRNNFIDLYDFQPEEMRKAIPREQWERDMLDLSKERIEEQKKSLLELVGFREMPNFKITGVEMVSASKAKIVIGVVSAGGLDERISYWEEFNGRWAPSKFLSRVLGNWNRAKENISDN